MNWLRRGTAVLFGLVAAAAVTVPVAVATPAPAPAPAGVSALGCSTYYFDGDPRLGPEDLPLLGSVGLELLGYHRTGNEPVDEFLSAFYDSYAGSWIYPPDSGFVIGQDGNPVEVPQVLSAGQLIDRYGSGYGSFLAPAGESYASRSIPPQSLDGSPAADCDYHSYRVLRPFAVDAGPAAPWFAQPGGGVQYELDAALLPEQPDTVNVLWLLDNGYLTEN
ncbi:MAG TPA: TNT domain-containing protein [Pseudonocardiaceae bacterium]|jgi:hypothetical protein|nr:TNT domain-containing protein [Pseudonocardiaceae bacterium]